MRLESREHARRVGLDIEDVDGLFAATAARARELRREYDETDERRRFAAGEIDIDDMQRLADQLGQELEETRAGSRKGDTSLSLFLFVQPLVCFVLREPRSFVRFEVFDHQAHVFCVEEVGTSAIAQRVDLASQALRRRTGRSLKVLVRHVQLSPEQQYHDFASRSEMPSLFDRVVDMIAWMRPEAAALPRPRRRTLAVGGFVVVALRLLG